MRRDCDRYELDIALLAGGDLADPRSERAVDEHLTSCGACSELLAALRGDLAAVAASASAEPEGADLAASVVAALAARPARARSGRQRRLWLEAAAALVLVGGLGAVFGQRHQVADRRPVPGAGETAVPVILSSLGGGALAMQWEGDGRELDGNEALRPYTVLASASPRDFSAARRIDVDGHSLVLETTAPSDGRITYFKVQ